jgi:HlyD family secretion protein
VAVLVDLGRVELRVFLPQRDIGRIRLGDPARARIDAFPEQSFEARVARVDQHAQFTPRDVHMPEERVTQVLGVTLALANPDGLLKPGMTAQVKVEIARREHVLTVPNSAIVAQRWTGILSRSPLGLG